MPALAPTALQPAALAPQALASTALGAPDEEPDPLLSWGTDFTTSPEDPADSGWSTYKATAVGMALADSEGMHLELVEGGGGDYQGGSALATGSFWYSASNSDQRDGFMVYKALGPAAGTSVSWDVRARLLVRDSAGTSNPPTDAGVWRAAALAVHDPDRSSYLRYAHIGPISEGLVPELGLEMKVNRVNASGGASVFPVVTHPGGDLDYDVRIVRRASDPQVLELHYRLVSSGEPLASDTGWTLGYVVDWTDGESAVDTFPVCPQEADAGLPDDVHVGLYVYSSATVHDCSAICPEILALPTDA